MNVLEYRELRRINKKQYEKLFTKPAKFLAWFLIFHDEGCDAISVSPAQHIHTELDAVCTDFCDILLLSPP